MLALASARLATLTDCQNARVLETREGVLIIGETTIEGEGGEDKAEKTEVE